MPPVAQGQDTACVRALCQRMKDRSQERQRDGCTRRCGVRNQFAIELQGGEQVASSRYRKKKIMHEDESPLARIRPL